MDWWEQLKAGVGVTGAVVAGLWGSLETAVQILLILMAVDIATGILAAGLRGELASDVGWRGLLKKAISLFIVIAATAAEPVLGGIESGTFVAGFYCACEGLSILENSVDAGVPVPTFLQRALAKLRQEMGGEEGEAVPRG